MNLSIPEVEIIELYRYAQILGCDFVFYDRFVQICADRGVSPSRAAIEAGLSKSTVTKWKTTPDAKPTGAALKKLSDYFGISIAELLDEDTEKAPTEIGERDILDKVDYAFYGAFKELTEDDKDTVRDMVMLMRQRRTERERK